MEYICCMEAIVWRLNGPRRREPSIPPPPTTVPALGITCGGIRERVYRRGALEGVRPWDP